MPAIGRFSWQKMIWSSGCYNSMMRNMITRQDYATYFGAVVTCLNFGHHFQLVFCRCVLPPGTNVARGCIKLCERYVKFQAANDCFNSFCRQSVTKIKAELWECENFLNINDSTHKYNKNQGWVPDSCHQQTAIHLCRLHKVFIIYFNLSWDVLWRTCGSLKISDLEISFNTISFPVRWTHSCRHLVWC